jgi:hypothetical protein
MISIQTIWALANQLGFDPAAFLVKAAEKTGLYAGHKAAAVAGKHVAGAVRAVVSYGANRINESFPEYLRERLIDVDEDQRTTIIEAAFTKWLEVLIQTRRSSFHDCSTASSIFALLSTIA